MENKEKQINNTNEEEVKEVKNEIAVSSTENVGETTTKETTSKENKDKSTNVWNYKNSSYWKNKPNYNCKGTKNKTKFPEFVAICKLAQMNLKNALAEELLRAGYTDVVNGDGYLYAKGEIPVLLTAHMDTVHKTFIEDFYEYYDKEKKQHIISSPQGIGGDDRCGVYMILQIIKTHKCSVLFCEDEEVGGRGSAKFCRTELIDELATLKYLIELDRANGKDAVFYDCDNDDFTKFIEENTGFKKAYGSFSDISNLSPECKVASVNLSCGYYNAHTTSEYVIIEEMMNTIEVVRELLNVECEQFEYIEKPRYYGGYSGRSRTVYDYGFYDDYDDYYDDYYSGYYGKNKNKNSYNNSQYGTYGENYNKNDNKNSKKSITQEEEKSLLVHVYDEVEDEVITYIANGRSLLESLGRFFFYNPSYCFDDIYDYEQYDFKVYDEGWYSGLYT